MNGTSADFESLYLARSIATALPLPRITPSQLHSYDAYIAIFDAMVRHPEVIRASRGLLVDGHCARAVEEAMKALNVRVKERSGLALDGKGLMEKALSLNDPRLVLGDLSTATGHDKQLGYMQILSGCMLGIRNPRAHDHRLSDSPLEALQQVILADHLLAVIDDATIASQPLQESPEKPT